MNPKTSLQVGFIVAALAAAGWMFWRSGDGRRINMSPYQSLGGVAGGEVSQLLGGQGKLVLVLADPGPDPDPVMDAQVAAFRGGLGSAGKVVIQATELIPMDGFVRMRTGGAMPPEMFPKLRQKYAEADAFVLFLGFPVLAADEVEQVKQGKAKYVVVSAALPWYEAMVNQGVIRLAIVPRSEAGDSAASPASDSGSRAAFDREYRILRAEATGPAAAR